MRIYRYESSKLKGLSVLVKAQSSERATELVNRKLSSLYFSTVAEENEVKMLCSSGGEGAFHINTNNWTTVNKE